MGSREVVRTMAQEWPNCLYFLPIVRTNGTGCGFVDDIASWMEQIFTTLARATSGWNQSVLEILSVLDKANKVNFHPAEELHYRLLILQSQAVGDSLP